MDKEFLKFLRQFIVTMITIFSVFLCVARMCTKDSQFEKPDSTPHFKFDPNRSADEIQHLNYKTGEVTYREYGPPPPLTYSSSYGVEDLILDTNLEVESLIEYQLD